MTKEILPALGSVSGFWAPHSWFLAPVFAPVASYLSCWGPGVGQLATRWPGLLHLQVSLLGATSYAHEHEYKPRVFYNLSTVR